MNLIAQRIKVPLLQHTICCVGSKLFNYLYSMKLLRVIVYSNLWIAIGAVAICQSGYLLLGGHLHWDALTLLVFIATWSVYLLIRLAAKGRISNYEPDDRWCFFFRYYNLMVTAVAIGFVAIGILFLYLSKMVQLSLIMPGLISVLYGLPLLARRARLRDISILKIFLIAGVWACTASILPAANMGEDIASGKVLGLFFGQFCFILAITIPFDIKDLNIDALNKVRTIPYYLGRELSYTLSFALLFTAAGILQYHQTVIMSQSPGGGVPVGVSMLIAGLLVHASRKKEGNMMYFFAIDGCMLLQCLLIWSYQQWV